MQISTARMRVRHCLARVNSIDRCSSHSSEERLHTKPIAWLRPKGGRCRVRSMRSAGILCLKDCQVAGFPHLSRWEEVRRSLGDGRAALPCPCYRCDELIRRSGPRVTKPLSSSISCFAGGRDVDGGFACEADIPVTSHSDVQTAAGIPSQDGMLPPQSLQESIRHGEEGRCD